MSSFEKNTGHDSSRPRLYLNGAVVVFAVILTATSLAAAFDLLLLILYVGLSTALTLLMYMIKLFLASKIQEQSDEKQIESKLHTINWSSILILSIAIMVALILPVILVVFVDPASWFIGFTSIATGMGLSEIILYRFTMNQRFVENIS